MEYNTTLRINDRLFYDIQEYCDKNDLDMREYLVELIEERHMINKYGDLNEIIPKAIEESKVEVKKRGRPKKKVEEEKKLGDGKAYEHSEAANELTKVLKDAADKKKEEPFGTVSEDFKFTAKVVEPLTSALDEKDKKSIEEEIKEESKPKPTAKRKRTLKTL